MTAPTHNDLRVRRLGWAGLELELEDKSLVIDLLEDLSPMAAFVGEARGPLPSPASTKTDGALVTHLHMDHTDPPALVRALGEGACVLRPSVAPGDGLETIALAQAEAGLAESGLSTREIEPWESVEVGPFTATAVPAVDGFGDPQVSWVVEAGGRRIFHGGDTVFHGSWWLIATRLGPFDAGFLPCNGPVCDFPHRQPPSPLASCLDPEQAAVAAHVLGARVAVPIHYDVIHNPPVYAQVDRPAQAFQEAAAALGVESRVLEPGEILEWAP